LAGQSNAQGYSGDAAFYPADPNGLDSQISLTGHTLVIQVLVIGKQCRRRMVDFHQVISDLKLPLVESSKCRIQSCHFQIYKPGTSIYANWKTPGDGGYYDDMITKLTSAVQLENLGHTVNIRGFIWIQGESDANNSTNANAYQANLSSIINDLRNNVVKNSDLAVILGVDEQFPG
jgi:hypothetical protein